MTSTLLRGGPVYSPSFPGATAIFVEADRIVAVGADAERLAAHADTVVNLGGALVTPAFVDAHVHLSQTGLALDGVDLSQARSRIEMLDLLAAHASGDSSSVILGFSWDDSTWAEPGPPTAAQIDRAVGDRAVYASRVDGHSAVLSSALAVHAPRLVDAAGWDGTGRVERDAHHVARDAAQSLIGEAQRRRALRRGLDHAASLGLGCVHEISAPHINPPSDLAAIRQLAAEAPTITVVPYWGELHAVDKALELGCVGAAGDLCMDGSLGSRTAALSAPYADADTSGHGYLTADQVREHVIACTRAGLQAGFHAIGDAGVGAAVDGIRAAATEVGSHAIVEAGHRVEHLEMVTPEQARTLAALGVVASVQPAFDAAWGGPEGMYAQRVGRRAAAMNPFAMLIEAGVTLAFGSDSPVTPLDPWGAVRAAINHRTESQRISLAQAFAAHTSGGWRAARTVGGGLTPGAAATYTVWQAAPSTVDDAAQILADLAAGPSPSCLRTMVDGVVVYDQAGALS